MNVIREINRINQREIELGGDGTTASWHDDYKDINMPRDKETGKPKGFAFIMYEDQRSTVLAVDNMNGGTVLGRTIRVDHVKDYKQPGKRTEEGEFQEPEAPSMNALPPVMGGSDASSSSSEEEDEDPMAAYIRAERKKAKASGKEKEKDKKKKKKSKHNGETKEERKARKAEKKAKVEKSRRGEDRALTSRESEARGLEEDVKPRVKREEGDADQERRRDRQHSPDRGNISRWKDGISRRHRTSSRSPSLPTPPRRSRRSPSRSRSPYSSQAVKREPGVERDRGLPARVAVKQETEEDVKPFRGGAPDTDRDAARRYSRSRSPIIRQVKREPSPDRDSFSHRGQEEAHGNGGRDRMMDREDRYSSRRDHHDSGADRYDRPRDTRYDSRSRADRDSDWRKAAGDKVPLDDDDRYGRSKGSEADYASWRGKRDVDRVMRTVGREERQRDDRPRR
ncbi:hypothetical protein QFC19_005487 [Naganishia cerealis]|uniref:Uncharacterized protein n=1 Tax=Naganishia cerealis TaxID=610337 RepID=A0ACC2VMX9_9TREE|nr:hypothetical protein QFC19_005487 [Naganishia cerealis]